MPYVAPAPYPRPNVAALKAARNKKRFLEVFPVIRDELIDYLDVNGMPDAAKDWFRRSLDYNTPGGKLNRGISVVDTVEILKGRPLEEHEYLKAAVLGWCIELLQAYFLVADDMMDQSVTRRGQACWYRVDGVSNIAINDSFMLEASIYHLLKKHFRSESYYVDLLELFHETTFQTEMGQLVDLITAPEDHVDLSKFSLEKHQLIVIYKTAYYSFYLPVACAMRMCGITSESSYSLAQSILIPLGEYFQVQDDYLDCYGSPEVIGKIGTDILDNKCSWNVNVALKRASEEQRRILDEHYGRKDSNSEAKVKAVFNEIGIPKLYEEYEQQTYDRLIKLIETIPECSAYPISPLPTPPPSSLLIQRFPSGSQTPSEYTPSSSMSPSPYQTRSSSPMLSYLSPVESCSLKREVFRSFLDKIYKRTK